MKIFATVGLSLVLIGAWSAPAVPPQQDSSPAEEPIDRFRDSEARLRAIQKAQILTPRRVDQANLLEGPPVDDPRLFRYPLGAEVHCDFVKAGSEMGGATNKFLCSVTEVRDPATGKVQRSDPQKRPAEVVKVKFDNREAFSEIAATRLLWAMGFFADSTYGVSVVCHDCPADPSDGTGERGVHRFEAASLERRLPGIRMKDSGGSEGWTWDEFVENSGLPPAQVDGFKMIAAFLMHSDSKKGQQALLCNGVKTDDDDDDPKVTSCVEPRLMISDVGATFGGGGRETSSDSKMDLEAWAAKRVWKQESNEEGQPVCRAYLLKAWIAGGGLKHPTISEEGRRFASRLLCALSDEQLVDLFTAARVSLLEDYRTDDGSLRDGLTEVGIVGEWVAEFKRRRQILAQARCSPISVEQEEVAGFPAVFAELPNHCAVPGPEPKLTADEAAARLLDRVQLYAALRQQELRRLGPLSDDASPEMIEQWRVALQDQLSERRSDAAQGDIFTPVVTIYLRQLIAATLPPAQIRDLMEEVKEVDATRIELKVNGRYPQRKGLVSMPAELLKALPELPEGLEYRIVDRHLLLLDRDANLVVDFIAHAISPDAPKGPEAD